MYFDGGKVFCFKDLDEINSLFVSRESFFCESKIYQFTFQDLTLFDDRIGRKYNFIYFTKLIFFEKLNFFSNLGFFYDYVVVYFLYSHIINLTRLFTRRLYIIDEDMQIYIGSSKRVCGKQFYLRSQNAEFRSRWFGPTNCRSS